MPSRGKFYSISRDFSCVQALTFMKLMRPGYSGTMHYVVEFLGDHNNRTRDIHDFMYTVRLNEIEIKQNLQWDSMKLKSGPSYCFMQAWNLCNYFRYQRSTADWWEFDWTKERWMDGSIDSLIDWLIYRLIHQRKEGRMLASMHARIWWMDGWMDG